MFERFSAPSGIGRRAFVCATPFQVLNALAITLAVGEGTQPLVSDIYIIAGFARDCEIADKLRTCSVFDNVVFIPASIDSHAAGARSELVQTHGLSVGSVGAYIDETLPDTRYEKVFFSSPTLSAEHLVRANPHAEVVLFDDGAGSYFGDILGNCGWSGRTASHMLLWHPAMANPNYHVSAISRPSGGRFQSIVEYVFGYTRPSEETQGRRIVFLSQPMNEMATLAGAREAMCEVLSAAANDLVSKPHPREKAASLNVPSSVADTRGHSMEVLCAQGEISDDHLLVGVFSTAQYLPAMMFDVHPYILFLYRIALADRDSICEMDLLAERMRASLYMGFEDRICIATSVNEAVTFIENFQARTAQNVVK